MVIEMNEEQSDTLSPDLSPTEISDLLLPDQARAIEKDMYNIMTTQVKLAIIQVVIAIVSLLTALIIAMLQ